MLAGALIALAGLAALLGFDAPPEAPAEADRGSLLSVGACAAGRDSDDAEIAEALRIPLEKIRQLHELRGLSGPDICAMPRNKLDRLIAKVDKPKNDFPGEAASFRAQQQASDDGTVRPDGLPNAFMERAARVSRVSIQAAGINPSAWTSLGPATTGGRIRTMVTHPTDPNLLLVGSVSGGIWRSTDGGASWAPINDFMPNVAISSLVRDPSNPQRVYAGTGEGIFPLDAIRGFGAYVSIDGGNSWSQLGGTVPDTTNPPQTRQSDFLYVNRIAVHPTNPDIVLLATRGYYCNWGGVYRSTNATSANPTWSLVYARRAGDVRFDPGNGNNVLIGELAHCADAPPAYPPDGGGIAYSSNAGASFSRVPLDTSTRGRVEVAWAPATPGLAVAVTDGNGGSGSPGRFWVSINHGQTWALNSQPAHLAHPGLASQGWYNNAVWVDPIDSRRVVVGGIDVHRGAGATNWWASNAPLAWTRISQWFTPGSVHADVHAFVPATGYNGTSNRILYVGNDGGLYRSNDIAAHDGANFTANWVNRNNGLQITQFYGGAGRSGYPGGATLIVGGAQDNGSLKAPATGLAWTEYFGGDGGFAAVDPVDPKFYYGEYVRAAIHRASTGGLSTIICGGPNPISEGLRGNSYCGPSATDEANFIAPFVLDPNNANTMLVGAKSLWRSTDVKTTTPNWFVVKGPNPTAQNYISAIAVAPGNSSLVWVGHNRGEVYCTTNGTATTPTWTKVGTSATRMVLRIVVDPSNANRVFVTYGGYNGGNVVELTDATQVCKASPSITDRHGNLPQSPVRTLLVHPTNPGWLYVGTEVGVFASIDGGATWGTSNDGPGTVSVDELFWLDPGTIVAATHGRGMFKAPVGTGTTTPAVATAAATGVGSTGATLNGTVSANGSTTTVTFEYGLTAGYGSTATAAQSPLGAGASNAAVSAAIGGLACNTQYHFRAVAANGAGTASGGDAVFATSACGGTTATTTTIASNANPATVGTTITITASVSGVSPTGGVAFSNGATPVAGCSLVALSGSGSTRSAACVTSALSTGMHAISASYGGDSANLPSTSAVLVQQVVAALPITGAVVANPYGTMSVTGGTLVGNLVTVTSPLATIQLGALSGAANSYLQIDFQGLHVGVGNTLTIRSGAPGQFVVLRNATVNGSAIGGLLQAQGGNGAPPPELYVWNTSGIAIAASGRIAALSGLSLDTLDNTWLAGQSLAHAGIVDGGPYLTMYAANVRGGGAFKANAIGLHTFGNANNPVNGANYLQNGLQLHPSTGAEVELRLNGYGPGKQVFNLFVNGNATAWMPSTWPAGYTLPANNAVVAPGATRPTGVPEPAYGGGSMILQASGSLALVNGGSNDFTFPGAIALKAGGTLDFNGVTVNQGWTTTGQSFQGLFFEAPSIVSTNGLIRLYGNDLNWMNFNVLPQQYVRAYSLKRNLDGSASFAAADAVAPHLNTYSVIQGAAAAGGCWVCLVNMAPVNVYGP